jgi:hypothetical protein
LAQFLGTCRQLFPFSDLEGSFYLGIGTSFKYYIERGGSMYDITPLRVTKTQSNPFTTTNGSNVVKVSIPDHGATNGDFVTFSAAGAIVVGGLTLSGEYQITSVETSSVFYIAAASNATSTATGGGTVTAVFQINTGTNSTLYANGWGAGTWGGIIAANSVSFTGAINNGSTLAGTTLTVSAIPAGTIALISAGDLVTGSGVSVSPPGSSATYILNQLTGTTGGLGTYTVSISQLVPSTATMSALEGTGWGVAADTEVSSTRLRLWSNDNYGQDLVINPRDAAIYYWLNSGGLGVRAVRLDSLAGASGVPAVARQIMVSSLDRKVLAFGCTDIVTGVQDRLLIRWSDNEVPTQWTPLEDNAAGGLRIPTGSEFMSAIKTKQEILVWTESAVHALKYIGAPFEYTISRLGMTTLAGPNAIASSNDVVFWMGANGFFQYDGRVYGLPCSVKDYVFNDLNWNQAEKICGGSNMSFNEVWWFYPSLNSEENDRYVVYNYNEKVWTVGTIVRTAWIDRGIEDYPRSAGADGYVYFHEIGQDDGSASPALPIVAYIESAPIEIGSGETFGFAWRMIPDLTFRNSSAANPVVNFVLQAQDYSGSAFSQTSDNDAARISNTTTSGGITTVTFPVEQFTSQTYFRLRGRMMSLRVQSDGLGVAWRLGVPRVDIRQDGRR